MNKTDPSKKFLLISTKERNFFKLGRGSYVDVIIPNSTISREHCRYVNFLCYLGFSFVIRLINGL